MLFIGGLPPLWNTDTGATAALLSNTLAAASAEGPSAAEEEEGAAAAAAAADSSASAAVNEDRSGECGGGAGRAASAIARGFVLSEGHDACYLSCASGDRVRVRRNGRECPSPESRRRLVEVYYFGASPKTSSPFIFSSLPFVVCRLPFDKEEKTRRSLLFQGWPPRQFLSSAARARRDR